MNDDPSVLLIEDDPLMRALLKSLLERLGFIVLACADGEEALSLVQREQPALQGVVSDFTMPGRDGVETLQALAKLRPGLPGILCSGIAEDDCLRGRVLDGCVYLGKPFQLPDLAEALRRLGLEPLPPT